MPDATVEIRTGRMSASGGDPQTISDIEGGAPLRRLTTAERLAAVVGAAISASPGRRANLSAEGMARIIDAVDWELTRCPGMQAWVGLVDVISLARHQGHHEVAQALHGLLLAAADDMGVDIGLLTRMLTQRTAWRLSEERRAVYPRAAV